MQSTNAKKYGNASYHVTVGMAASAALTGPEEDSLAMADALGFGGYDTDVLADASSTLADLDGKAGLLNIGMLA